MLRRRIEGGRGKGEQPRGRDLGLFLRADQRAGLAQPPAGRRDVAHEAAEGLHLRVGLEVLDLHLELGRVPEIVGVEKGEVARIGRGGSGAPIAGAGGAAAGAGQDPEPRVLDRPDAGERAVGRAVVDDDQLEVGQRLGEHRLCRRDDEPLGVVGGDDYADEHWRPGLRPKGALRVIPAA